MSKKQKNTASRYRWQEPVHGIDPETRNIENDRNSTLNIVITDVIADLYMCKETGRDDWPAYVQRIVNDLKKVLRTYEYGTK